MEILGIILWAVCLALAFYKLGAQEGEAEIHDQAEQLGFGETYTSSDGRKRFHWRCGREEK